MFRRPVLLSLVLLACNGADPDGEPNVSGSVPEADGATSVRAVHITPEGETTTLTSTELAADGSFSLSLEVGLERIIFEAQTDTGEVTAAGMLEVVGEGELTLLPLDPEHTVEARVALQAADNGFTTINLIDVRTRIDAELAAAVLAEGDAGINVLAEAVASAQATEAQVWGTSQTDLFQAELDAGQAYTAGLAAGSPQLMDTLYSDLRDAAEAEGLDAGAWVEGGMQAALAFRLVVVSREGRGSALGEAAVIASLRDEGRLIDPALVWLVSGDAGVESEAASAGNSLTSGVSAATTVGACVSAWSTYQAELVGTVSVSGSLMVSWTGADAGVQSKLNTVLTVARNASRNLGDSAESAVDGALGAGTANAAQVATAVRGSWDVYRGLVEGAAKTGLGDLGAQAGDAEAYVVIATGGFAAAE